MRLNMHPKTIVSTVVIFAIAAFSSGTGLAVPLPVLSTFDADAVDAAPGVGGANQPSALIIPSGGNILVESFSHGIDSQHAELLDDGGAGYLSMEYFFSPVASDILRIEAVVSIDSYRNGYFLQAGGPGTVVWSRLGLSDDGTITDYDSAVVGNYIPDRPFRVRMDVDINNKVWSASVDNELNGFGDDPVLAGLLTLNDPGILTDVSWVGASLNAFGGQPATTVAYDDVSISVIPEPASIAMIVVVSGCALFLRRFFVK